MKKAEYELIKLSLRQIESQNFNVVFTPKQEVENNLIIKQQNSLLFDQIKRIRGCDTKRVKEMILVEAKRNKKQENTLEQLIHEGFSYNGLRYLRFGKSASQSKDGITAFVEETIFEELFRMSQLDLRVTDCVVSKYETQRCLIFSTCTVIDRPLPYIVVVGEYKKTIPNQRIKYVVEQRKEYTDKETGELKTYLHRGIEEGFRDIPLSPFDGCGCHSHEFSESISRYLGLDYIAIGAQIRLPFFKGYSVEVPFKEYYQSIGVDRITDIFGKEHHIKDIDCIWNVSMFKGYDLFRREYGCDGWTKYLEVLDKYEIKLGISKYSKQVKDLNLKSKMNFQYLQCLNLWNPKLLECYHDKTLQSFDPLDPSHQGPIIKLAAYSTGLYEKIIKGDKFYTYKFLGIGSTDDLNACESPDSYENGECNSRYVEAILINDIMLRDPAIKQYLYRKLKKAISEMKLGKLYSDGFYHTVVGDMIGYLEFAAGLDPKGCLHAKEFYCETIPKGAALSFRSPLVCPSEVNDITITENDLTKKWFPHFKDQDIVMLNLYDLSAPQQGGMDEDGDAVFLCHDKLLVSAKIHKTIIIDMDDKITVNPKPYNQKSILEYEINSRDNRIGEITNTATSILNRYTENAEVKKLYDDFVSLLRIYQGKEIDYLKTGVRWQMSSQLRNHMKQLPYFLLYNYPEKLQAYKQMLQKNKSAPECEEKAQLNGYRSPSPLNELCDYICRWEKGILWDRSVTDTRSLILDQGLELTDQKIIRKIKHGIHDFSAEWKRLLSEKAHRHEKEQSSEEIMESLLCKYQVWFSQIVPDPYLLANYVISVSYSNLSINKYLAWKLYGDVILQNLKSNSPPHFGFKILETPISKEKSQEYLGRFYELQEEAKENEL
ncbi:RNA dependent RNA polymerase [Sinanaerobacter chloroacetimidivorans]|uniref:RDRP core domain-containing protein n=1 Tax=Sinanaerobacter chloroacetimidivorans TaxID=2818044 RepID=A0A8J7W0J0_9FIRM|nr:hypothetical protein [Sinanaerobacter chloroacetimidivorans]MBR0596956.1 hypothetical protein [Sinanaerobacter chloroacetimidivorans]